MAEGLQAGRLEVPVVADLTGFAARLRTAVETAAEGLAAKVTVEIDKKGLRRRLKEVVKEASKGVTAKIRIEIDEDRFRTALDGIRRRIGDTDVSLPVRPDGDGDGPSGGSLLARLRGLINGAQGEADRNPVNVPVNMRMPGRGRGGLRMLGIGALVSLLQPAVALIGQYGAGLTALVSAAAPAVGVLGAIPGLIAAAGSAAIGTKLAFSGFGEAIKQSVAAQRMLATDGKVTEAQQKKLAEALDKLSPSARKAVSAAVSLQGAWGKVRKSISERFFSKVADDIKPLANSVLPLLKGALGDSASQMGSFAERGAKFMQTGVFRKDFKTIAGTNNRVLGNMTNGLANLGRGTMDFLVASGPFVERVSKGGERMTQWFRASMKAGRETGSLAKFLDHAGDKAAQLGRSSLSLVKGLGAVGRAGMETGNALLDGFEGTMKRFERWANSKAGQEGMKKFFSDAAPLFHELNALVGDFVRGMGRAMQDVGVVDLVRQIRTQLMPALGNFFSSIGQSVGPAIVSAISNIATAIGNLAGAGTGLGVLLAAFSGLLAAFNWIMNVVPGANTALATLLGTLLALKVITAVSGMLRNFGTSVAAAGTSVTSLGSTMRGSLGPGVLGPQATLWQRMSGAYRTAATEGGRLSGALRGIGAANGVASRAMGGMVSALGGPLGLAIAGVTIGLGLLAAKQQESARAAEAHRERVSSLARALADSNGVIDANVRAQTVRLLQDTKLADGNGKLVDVMRDADVSLKTLTDAYLEQGGSVDGLQKKLLALAEANKPLTQYGRAWIRQYDEQGQKYKDAADALGSLNGELKKSRRDATEAGKAMNDGATAGVTAYDRLQAAVKGFSDKTQAADQRVEALKAALDALSGNAQSFHDAQTRLNAVMLQIGDSMKGTTEKSDGWGKALVDTNGMVDTATRNGQALNSQLGELRTAMLGVATSAMQSSEQGVMPLAEAMNKSQGAMEQARTKAIQLAMDMGIPAAQAKALADQMGFIPSTITTLMTTQGMPEATAEVLSLRTKLEGLGAGKTIRISAPTTEAWKQLEALGFQIQRIPGSKNVAVTAPTGGARANLSALTADIANAPNKKTVTVNAIVKQAAGELKDVQRKVVDLPPGKSITVKAPTQTAQSALKDLKFKIEKVDNGGKTVKITAPTGTPLQQVQSIQSKINQLTGKTVHVTIKYSTLGKPYVENYADGGIRYFANGGLHRTAGRVKAFANGAENHIAQIARPGQIRVWNEPETQGEAYLPLANSKRRRSKAILDRVAQIFGGRVVYFANGGVNHTQGAVRTPAASSGGRTVAATAAGSPALVGGDLNVNVAQVGTVRGALDEALFELRRIQMGGGGLYA
ncbi:hypothetical protein ACIP93_33350 [Streptomyces sp. NPDC088745]|uniref:hypothetical protein n=1 Tax=Streptomyces sp. NPDC088745 TaxID=3365884 RepID=UPI0038159E5A